MKAYINVINSNRDKVDIKIIQTIDDKTLNVSFFRQSNIFCDGVNYYISHDFNNVLVKSKKELRSFLAQVNGKMRLYATNNSIGYTRLIYKIYLK